MALKILIVDDHQLVLDGIRLMLQDHKDIFIVGEAHNGQDAIDFVEKGDEIDVVVMDLNMPEINGIQACKRIKKIQPEIKVLILSMISEQKMIKNVMSIGANGYMLKNSGQEELIEAILRVHSGINHFDERIIQMMLNPTDFKEVKNENLHPSLSRREKEILNLIVEEYTTGEIAKKLFISFGTVESHRRNMISKLGVRNTAGLVSAAYKFDLIEN